jgi:hypothetical protein
MKGETVMNKQDKQEPDSQQSLVEVEDLTLSEDQAAELKGGPVSHQIDVYWRVIDNSGSL